MTTGDRIKMRRKEISMSAEQLAEKVKLSPATIYRYEKGDIEKVPVDMVKMIASALGTTPAFLMGWGEDQASPIPSVTPAEFTMVEKFRTLDDRGQSAVLSTLEHEYQVMQGDGQTPSLSRHA